MQVESLESRNLLACVLGAGATYDAVSGILNVAGTNGSDNIAVLVQATDPDSLPGTGDETSDLVVTRNGSPVASCSLLDAAAPINRLVIDGGNGNDTITVDDAVLVSVQANGGNGQDVIDGGGGNDTLSGGNGKDSLDGAAGDDQVDGGNGADNLQGGLGVDILNGGNGPDTLADPDGDQGLDGGHGPDTINGLLEQGHGNSGHGHGHGH
jgi:Ca2+-binding RTX toxin-like protein